MKKPRKRIFMAAGYNTVALGTGRKEFNPKKPRPGLEDYIKEAGNGVISQINDAENIDECVVSNFNAQQFNNQGNLAGFMPFIHPKLEWKPATGVEGACGSGGLGLMTGIKSVLAEVSDTVLALGVEVQNSVKAIYTADYLATAGWARERKNGHVYFFPNQFSQRAGEYYKKYGEEITRLGMATWYKNAIENSRVTPTAQEHHNDNPDLMKFGLTPPNAKFFLEHLNLADCSKVSDGASAILIASEEGLEKLNIPKSETVEIVGFAQVERNITTSPPDRTELTTVKIAAHRALEMAGITIDQLATVETHDCFSIAGIMGVEALGFAPYGEGAKFVADGNTSRDGKIPFNTTGGLIGWGHPVGATGVHQAVTIWEQLTGKAGDSQINIPENKPYGLTINMGGDDVTVVAIVYKKVL